MKITKLKDNITKVEVSTKDIDRNDILIELENMRIEILGNEITFSKIKNSSENVTYLLTCKKTFYIYNTIVSEDIHEIKAIIRKNFLLTFFVMLPLSIIFVFIIFYMIGLMKL